MGDLPKTLGLNLLEPPRELFKAEVRALGLPPEMVQRHPVPVPGLSVRIFGEVIPEFVKRLQRADAIFIEALHAAQDSATCKIWNDPI
jgi:GMP synthase (glutamine-hydrolysing)